MADNIFEKLTDEEQDQLWMYMIFNRDKIIEKTEQWTKEAEKRGMTLAEYLESIDPLNEDAEYLDQEPCGDCISRQAVLEYIESSEAELGHSSENELVCQDITELPRVTPQPKMGLQIPEVATNGEVVELLFSNVGVNFSNVIDLNLWWQAKYKRMSEVNK